MPNWCTNRWEISCETEEQAIEIFHLMTTKESVEGQLEVTFNKLIPMPEILRKTGSGFREIDGVKATTWINDEDSDGKPIGRLPTPEEAAEMAEIGHGDWYSWSIANWGCKWDASSIFADLDHAFIRLEFSTPWGPPENVLTVLRERFPDIYVSAFFDEPGAQTAGYL